MRLSCVILTAGGRQAELDRAVRSVHAQEGADVEVVVVGNGAAVPRLSEPVKELRLPSNAGIPGGRNHGVAACAGDVVLFLDDDGWYPSRGLAARVAREFEAGPSLAVLSFRVQDPEGRGPARRHVPRLRADPDRSGAVTTFLGGACAIRRAAFEAVEGLPGEFFYSHEETDFAWRVLDAGYRIRYDAEAVMCHPAVTPSRHEYFYRLNARNRVWLARRNLPWPLAACYLADWVAITLARERSTAARRAWFAGFAEGWRASCGPRRPISWRTAWTMTKAGRPPIV
ncbi:MAG: glycosyltransferase family 2 protein [Streptosporangiaceae bacterium]